MRIKNFRRNNSRIIVFPLRISKNEKDFLERQALSQGKSIADLIREGYIEKRKEIDMKQYESFTKSFMK